MPELPEVEVQRRYLNATSLHRTIDHVRLDAPRLLHESSPQGLGRRLGGHRFDSTQRHGKYLFAVLDDGGALVMHFGMSGRLTFARKAGPPRHTACLLFFRDDSHLAYVAPRRLGGIEVADSCDGFIRRQALGPDALTISRDQFREAAHTRRGGIKAWLMDQQAIAGIGNVYSDEILFQSELHPQQAVRDLDGGCLRDLYRCMRKVLTEAIDAHADPRGMPAGFLLPHRRADGHCPRCGGQVEKLSVSGRTAWYCPTCQSA